MLMVFCSHNNHLLALDATRIMLFLLVWLRTVGDAIKMRMTKRFSLYALNLCEFIYSDVLLANCLSFWVADSPKW